MTYFIKNLFGLKNAMRKKKVLRSHLPLSPTSRGLLDGYFNFTPYMQALKPELQVTTMRA